MPNRETDFPPFPTSFSEEEAKRTQELETRAKELRKAYGTSFAPSAWKQKPWYDRTWRRVAEAAYIPSWIGETFQKWWEGVTPWTETGFTPEMVGETIRGVEEELFELKRQQQVSERMPTIIDYMVAMALQGYLSGSEADLYKMIPELNPESTSISALNLSGEERSWLIEFNTKLAGKSQEEIEQLYVHGFASPKTEQELLDLVNVIMPTIDPRYIMSTVAFSKDVDEITKALQMAHPPQTEESFSQAQWDKIKTLLKDRGVESTGNWKDDVQKLLDYENEKYEGLGQPVLMQTSTQVPDSTGRELRKMESVVLLIEREDGFYSEDEDTNLIKVANKNEQGNPVALTLEEQFLLDNRPRTPLMTATEAEREEARKVLEEAEGEIEITPQRWPAIVWDEVTGNWIRNPEIPMDEEEMKPTETILYDPPPTAEEILANITLGLSREEKRGFFTDVVWGALTPSEFFNLPSSSLFCRVTAEAVDWQRAIARPDYLPGELALNLIAGTSDLFRLASGATAWMGAEGFAAQLNQISRDIYPTNLPYRSEAENFCWWWAFDPRKWSFLSTQLARQLPFTLALLPLAIIGWKVAAVGVGAVAIRFGIGAFWTRVLSTIFGGALGGGMARLGESAMEAGDTFDRILANDGSLAEAGKGASEVFWNNMKLAGSDALQVAASFVPIGTPATLLGRGITKNLFRVVRVGGRMTVVGLTEGGEEYAQLAFQRMAFDDPNPWRIDAEAQQAATLGFLMGVGMGGGGEILSNVINGTKDNMTPAMKESYDKLAEKKGEAAALDEMMADPEMAQVVESVAGAVVEEENNKRITDPDMHQHTKERELNQDMQQLYDTNITFTKNSLEAAEGKLVTMVDTGASKALIKLQQTEVDALTKRLEELMALSGEKSNTTKRIDTKTLSQIKNVEEKLRKNDALIETHEKSLSIMENQAAQMEESPAKEAKVKEIERLKTRLAVLSEKKALYGKQLETLNKTLGERAEAPTPVVEAIPMPVEEVERRLSAIPVGEPGLSQGTLAGYQGDVYVYRDPQGNPVAVMTVSTATGEAVVGSLVAKKEKSLILGKAAKAFEAVVVEKKIKIPSDIEMTPQGKKVADKFRKRLELREQSIEKEAPVAEPTETQLRSVMDGEGINEEVAEAQSVTELGLPETTFEELPDSVVESIGKELRTVLEEIDKHFFNADINNPLDRAASIAWKSGDIPVYVRELPPEGTDLVSEDFKEAADNGRFQEAAEAHYNSMDTIRAFAFMDFGRFGGIARRKILSVTERMHLAYLNTYGVYESRYSALERITGFNKLRPGFLHPLKKATFHNDTWHLMAAIGSEDVAVPTDTLLKRKKIKDAIGKYSEEEQRVMIRWASELRALWDDVLADQNAVRKKLGLPEIEPIENYVSWVYAPNIWSRLMGQFFDNKLRPDFVRDPATTPDLIFPSEPFVPHALARKGGLGAYPKVRDVRRLFLDYVDTACRDMFFTPIILNVKAHVRYLKHEKHDGKYDNIAAWMMDWVSESYAGSMNDISKAIRKFPFVKSLSRPMIWLRRRLTSAVFALNWPWNFFVQTSSMALTMGQFGVGNTLQATRLWLTDKSVRHWVQTECYSHILKQRRVGSVIYQDLGRSITEMGALRRSPLETLEEYMNFMTRIIETNVTGISCYAAYLEGKRRGYTGRRLIDYASEGGAKTQSMYNLQNVPGVLRSREVGALFPFQTFCFEALNYARELSGVKYLRAGAYETIAADTAEGKALIRKRLMLLAEFMGAVFVLNIIGELGIRRKPWQPSSFIPFYGMLAMGAEPFNTWNYPLPARYVLEAKEGWMHMIEYGEWQPLREWVLRYHFPGGVQIDRTLTGIIASVEGSVTGITPEGELGELYELEPGDWIKAITMGVAQTESYKDYRTRMEGADKQTDTILNDFDELEEQLGTVVDGKDYTLRDYRSNVLAELKKEGVPDSHVLDEAIGYQDLARFAVYCEYLLEEYRKVPSDQHLDYRAANPYIDAVLYFWETVSSLRSTKAKTELAKLLADFNIGENPRAHWRGLPEVPEWAILLPE